MFNSVFKLKKQTPKAGIYREEYIALLISEYYETSDIEAKHQVTANLTNFSYDPINYKFLRSNSVVSLFLELIKEPDRQLILHGISGICNICLDIEFQQIIMKEITSISHLLYNPCSKIILTALTTLYLICSPDTQSHICIPENIKQIKNLWHKNNDKCIKTLATIFLSNFSSY